MNKPSSNHSILTDITTDKELVANFMEYMKLITKQTWVELAIDTNHPGIARMQPGNTKVFFNPIFTLHQLQAIADEHAKKLGVESTFQFTINHLSEIVLHEINHMINHSELKLSKKTEKIEKKRGAKGEPRWRAGLNMTDYQKALYEKYGADFKEFENIFEDIDVNNHATKLQAPVFERPKQEIYQHICAPDSDFSQQPLQKQFERACLRESMIDREQCTIDPLVRNCVNYIAQPWGLLETIRNPKLSYDEQLPAIHRLYEDYYLPLKEKQKEREEKQKKEPQNGSQQNEQGNQQNNSDQQNNNQQWWGQQPWQQNQQSPEGAWTTNSHIDPMLLPHLFDNPDGFPQNSGNQENSEQAPKPNSSKNKNTLERLLDTLKGKKEEKKKGEQEKRTDTGQRPVDSPKAKIQEALSKAVEEKIQEDQKTPEDRSLEEFITKTRNLDPKTHKDQLNQIKQEIQQQKQLEQLIKKLTDSQGRNVYDRIVNEIFSKIVQTHKLPQIYEKSPRPFSEGGQFDAQSLAWGIMSRKSGNDDPLMMQQIAKKEKELKKAGAFNITFITDGSWSMSGQKNTDQKLSTLLMLYALEQLNAQLAEGDLWLKESFPIETQVLMFQGSKKVETIKERNTQLWLKEVMEASKKLDYDNGNDTNAYDAIQQYYDQISTPLKGQTPEEYEERLEKVKEGKTKEILFVMSDGGFNSGDDQKAKKLISKLRKMGIIVCGIGITAGGSPMISIFGKKSAESEENKGGFWLVCKETTDLWTVLNSLLLEHLEDPSIVGEVD